MKATALAPSNLAFIKYWGKKDEELTLPENGSISMNLSNLTTTTTVEFRPDLQEDTIIINGQQEANEGNRVIKHLDRVRRLARINDRAKVVTENDFPTATGLSSSASGFAALTLAAVKAAGLVLTEKELSILARQGSGSACRSIPDGFVEWVDGETSETSYAVSLYPPAYWDIADVIAVVSKDKKYVSTTKGHTLAQSSPFFPVRLARMKNKIELVKQYLQEKDFPAFGKLVEAEALELHAIMLTSDPPLVYWLPGTVEMMRAVRKWRQDGLQVYFSVNTGQDIHLLCWQKDAEEVADLAHQITEVQKTVVNRPSEGAHIVNHHLF